MPEKSCTCGLSAALALLRPEPGLREALEFVKNDLLDIADRTDHAMLRLYARRSIERIDALLASAPRDESKEAPR